ncbi:uncharacterized protein B0P05DRAFT_479673 [Gilbertella persicaria]|uniref:uncharacterized protein n=1 Tax=Gilbertella persicaria TaxID=101096 RepID=UPI00221E6B2B|nr:uncharacterized protein B0P05DRAFT_479673 [Gilbertella persicaria]KAI8053669.1 hypothetical protein B0P05DRAFT_479673 [Gilbertella persicaria]
MANTASSNNTSGLPVIPLSPIAQSYIICSNALNLATEKLTEAKKANPPVQVGVLRGYLETSKVEAHRLNALTRKMQSVEAATPLFWDSDGLARQIAIMNAQLFNQVFLDKRSLLQLDLHQTKLVHLVDFHHYLSHSMAHQLIYWAELLSNNSAASAVVPPVHATKDSLVTHLVRVAYLLLHAYRDFSGFAAIMKALTFPEVRRLNKKLWHGASSRTKDMFRELAQIISPAKHYEAYHHALKHKLEQYHTPLPGMIAVPWVHPHLVSIRSIVTAYTAGDEDTHHLGDVVLSAPGAHKLDMVLAILELCQLNAPSGDVTADDVLSTQTYPNRRSSVAHSKAIHVEGLRAAVIPVANLSHLAPGDQLTQHWLVSRVYLRKDQLINESIEVEPLKKNETIACEDDFGETGRYQSVSHTTSRRTSLVPPPPQARTASVLEMTEPEFQPSPKPRRQRQEEEESSSNTSNDDDGPSIEEQPKVIPEEPIKEEEEEVTKPVIETEPVQQEEPVAQPSVLSTSTTESKQQKSRLSPTAPEFVPNKVCSVIKSESTSTDEKWLGYPIQEDDDEVVTLTTTSDSEKWVGYPAPATDEDDDKVVWKGYPGPNSSTDSPRRASSQSETSEEWKGYHATKMEADWQRESALKVQEHEWQGYTLETLDEDELDSSTMMDGEFEKSRQARGRQQKENFCRNK